MPPIESKRIRPLVNMPNWHPGTYTCKCLEFGEQGSPFPSQQNTKKMKKKGQRGPGHRDFARERRNLWGSRGGGGSKNFEKLKPCFTRLWDLGQTVKSTRVGARFRGPLLPSRASGRKYTSLCGSDKKWSDSSTLFRFMLGIAWGNLRHRNGPCCKTPPLLEPESCLTPALQTPPKP